MTNQVLQADTLSREGRWFIDKAAKCDKNVLILGETGTGKDVAARRIHELSSRNQAPFVALNCASLPDNLIEAELFGTRQGSFTGAVRQKEGLFESAGKGTVFVDEIGELSFHLQAKLLRVIDEREARRIGETSTRRISGRFIFATNKDLRQEVKAGTFRKDLYFRINVVRIWMPPLREKKNDIPLLVHHFLERENRRNSSRKDFSPEALKKLMSYDFPGNIRELENIIERAFILSEGEIIRDDDLELETEDWPSEKSRPITPEHLRKILEGCLWDKTKTTGEIGRSRRRLYRLLEKYRMDDCIRRSVFF